MFLHTNLIQPGFNFIKRKAGNKPIKKSSAGVISVAIWENTRTDGKEKKFDVELPSGMREKTRIQLKQNQL